MAAAVRVPTMPRLARAAVSALALGGALYVGAAGVGPLPPLGPLLDPAHGLVAPARSAELPVADSATLAGLGADVTIRYDDRGVPHVFAHTMTDAARATGWVQARDRLFQMELTQRSAAGTLTERVAQRAQAGGISQKVLDAHLLGLAQPIDVARAVLYLASDDSCSTTGHVLTVDSGITIS